MEKQTFEEYEQKRTDALEAFRNFLKECSKKKIHSTTVLDDRHICRRRNKKDCSKCTDSDHGY